MNKYLITGGAGFIGSNIVKKLLEAGDNVRVVDNFSTGRRENIQEFIGMPNFELEEGDLSDLDLCRRSVQGIDFVLHQAAIPSVPRSISDPIISNNSNISATLNLLVASRDAGIKKFVFASSSSVYGDNPELPKKEDFPANPISPYALTKYAGERYAQLFYQIFGLPTICLRYFNVFGPKQDPESQYAAVVPKFISALLSKQSPVVFGDGEQTRDFTFVDNVVQANLLAAQSRDGIGDVFNIACGDQISLNKLLELLREIIGVNTEAKYEEPAQGDIFHSRADISKARRVLRYDPSIELKPGLIKTIEWFRRRD